MAPLERAGDERRRNIVIMGLVSSLTLVALITLFRRLVMRPVKSLTASIRRFARGELSERTAVLGRNELAVLAQNFNHMGARIEDQVARIEAASAESDLLYTLVVEASRRLETSEVAASVSHVMREKLHPRYAAFFLETADGGWICATGAEGQDEPLASGDDTLEAALASNSTALQRLLGDIPLQLIADACRTQKLHFVLEAEGLTFALPVTADGRCVGLLICAGISTKLHVGEQLLTNLGAHLTLAAANSRHYTGAITDSLTRLKNKRYGLARIEEAIFAARRYKSEPGIAMCDVDHFKQVNDTYGHPAGDAVLKELGRRLAGCVRKADIVVRSGGEEFMFILPGAAANSLLAMGEKIRDAVSRTPFGLGAAGATVPMTLSVGVTAFRVADDSAETMIKRADSALYRAKHGGRNRVELDC